MTTATLQQQLDDLREEFSAFKEVHRVVLSATLESNAIDVVRARLMEFYRLGKHVSAKPQDELRGNLAESILAALPQPR